MQAYLKTFFKNKWDPGSEAGVTVSFVMKNPLVQQRHREPHFERRSDPDWMATSALPLRHDGVGLALLSFLTSPTPKHGEVREVKHRNPITMGQNKLHTREVKGEVKMKFGKLREVKENRPTTLIHNLQKTTALGTLKSGNPITTALSTPSPGGVSEALRDVSETLVRRLRDFKRRQRDLSGALVRRYRGFSET